MSNRGVNKAVKWEELSKDAREVMAEMGDFSATVRVQDRLVKGYTSNDYGEVVKTYYGPDDLRKIAAACQEVACFLEARSNDEADQ